MPKISMWWLFFVLFGLTIGGIQSLGWLTRTHAAQTQSSPCKGADDFTTASIRQQNGESKHWRSAFMQQ